jgi:hypothetical protein
MINKIVYPFPEKALKKWASLFLIPPADDKSPFVFIYEGSTCRNGGVPFKAHFTASISSDLIIKNPRIEIPESEQEGASHMCSSGYITYKGPGGENLEEFILREMPQNFAGCLCYPPQINQKWKMVASTIHYYLSVTATGSETKP